ncbi:MAG: chitobiase, partial [Prevotella sp.]|nr:chitobiase [Prevotellaceae bacterium]MDY5249398.1 chitobiase [Prevotella sp.]
EATSIEAGKPYLFKPANTVPNPVFEGVTITSADAGSVTVTNTNGNYAFVGTYSKKDMATDQSEVFITTSGKLSYPAEGKNTIKGMRAYIMLPTTANAKAFNLNIGGEATSIDTIDGGLLNGNATIYNLNGQKMSSDINGLAKGLYIVNGKKMIVK